MSTDPTSGLRACGECRACCSGPEIAELAKPRFEPCSHLTEHGCGIHGRHPESCREYQCGWKSDPDVFLDDERPDALGVYFAVNPSKYDGLTGEVLESTIDAWEAFPGGLETDRAQASIARVLAHYTSRSPGTIEGMEVVRFGDPTFYWIEHPGGTPFHVRKQELADVGEDVERFERRKPKSRLDVVG